MSCNSYSKPYSIILLKQYASATIKNITPYFFSCFVLLFDHSTLFILRPLAVSKSFNLVDFSALSQGCSFLKRSWRIWGMCHLTNLEQPQLCTTFALWTWSTRKVSLWGQEQKWIWNFLDAYFRTRIFRRYHSSYIHNFSIFGKFYCDWIRFVR
jgi:hypothetical protein